MVANCAKCCIFLLPKVVVVVTFVHHLMTITHCLISAWHFKSVQSLLILLNQISWLFRIMFIFGVTWARQIISHSQVWHSRIVLAIRSKIATWIAILFLIFLLIFFDKIIVLLYAIHLMTILFVFILAILAILGNINFFLWRIYHFISRRKWAWIYAVSPARSNHMNAIFCWRRRLRLKHLRMSTWTVLLLEGRELILCLILSTLVWSGNFGSLRRNDVASENRRHNLATSICKARSPFVFKSIIYAT